MANNTSAGAKTASKKTRIRMQEKHKSFRLSNKRIKPVKTIPSLTDLVKQCISVFWSNKKVFGGISLIYLIASFVFVQGLGASFDLVTIKQNLEHLLGESSSQLTTAFALLGYMFGSAGSQATGATGAYQFFLFLVVSLASIWAVRQIQAGEKPPVKASFYKGMYPLIPFIIVLVVIGLQLMPFALGNLLYSTVIQNGLAITAVEKFLWLILFILLAILSIYMVVSSLMALYIVTLPDMTPLKALRSARDLVLHRRLGVGVRIFVLPVIFLIATALVFVPVLIFATPLAQPLFLVVSSLALVFAHVYMYLLYRSLL
jgi:hypothetical protein